MAMTAEVFAAPPAVTYDETLYVNMDRYGSPTKTSIVKNYSLNSNTSVTDHGEYSDVINMTDYTEPDKKDGSVTFDFSKAAQIPKRFYFEGKNPKLSSELPWNIDVSYKLNGVPAKAEDLAGANGLIEIDIDILPNDNAADYYKNNFILEAACVADTDDILSIEAPGSQMITIGSLKNVVFFALPGEEQHYTVSIGSDDFEFSGMLFMMQPATMSQVDDIKDLRDAKEDIEDSADAISDSLDVVLDTLDSMQSSLKNTSEGLKGLQKARETVSNSKGAVYEDADAALDEMEKLSDSLSPYSQHFDTAQDAVEDINTDLNNLNSSLQSFTDTLNNTKENTQAVKENLSALDELITTADEDKDKWESTLTSLSENLRKLSDNSDNLNAYLKGVKDAGNNLGQSLETLSSDGNVGYISDSLMESFMKGGDVNSGGIWAVLYSIQYLASDLSALSRNVGNICGLIADDDTGKDNFDIEKMANDTADLAELAKKAIDNAYSHSDDYHSIIENSQEMLDIISDAADKTDETLNAINSSVNTANRYKKDLQVLITDSQSTVTEAQNSLKSFHSFLSKFESTLKTAGNDLDSGTEATLNGLIDTLAKSITGLAQTSVIKNAKDTVKNLIDDKWDEYTGDDNNLLNIDSSLPAVSFTSAENPAPETVQVILRTDEIVKDDDDSAPDLTEDDITGNVFTRIVSVFRKIISTITGVFKK